MNCEYCGTQLLDDANFCFECGKAQMSEVLRSIWRAGLEGSHKQEDLLCQQFQRGNGALNEKDDEARLARWEQKYVGSPLGFASEETSFADAKGRISWHDDQLSRFLDPHREHEKRDGGIADWDIDYKSLLDKAAIDWKLHRGSLLSQNYVGYLSVRLRFQLCRR